MSFIAIAVGTVVAAGVGAVGSNLAASTQANAAKSAAQLQYNLGEQSLAFNEQQYNQGQQNLAPWIKQGQNAVTQLGQLQQQGANGTGPLAPWTGQFQAPTAAQAANYPGYQFQLQQGQNAVSNSAAARGGLVSGNAATALDQYSQGLAQSDYGNVYNQALQQYQLGYNQYEQNQTNLFNRYASLAGLGQTSAAQAGQLGQSAANTQGNISGTIGSQVGQNINNAGAATASGYIGGANSIASGVGNLTSYLQLQNLLGGSSPFSAQQPYYVGGSGAPGGNFYAGATNPLTVGQQAPGDLTPPELVS